MRRTLLLVGLAVASLASLSSRADVGPPAHLRISEREPGVFVTQWRVPKALPPRAVPAPELAERCTPEGDLVVDDQAQAWIFTQDWRCEAGLAGEEVQLRFPFADLALTTVIRVDLLSGDRFAHVSSPGEGPWRLPEGTAAPDRWGDAARAVGAGLLHVFGSWAHLPFVLAVGLLGGIARSIRVVTAFTLGQLAGVLLAVPLPGLGVAPAEIALAVAAALIAREGLRPVEDRRRLVALGAIAGAVHGLAIGAMLAGGLGDAASGLGTQILAVLGMDAGQLVAAVVVAAVASFLATGRLGTVARRGLAYASGAAGIALALGLALTGGITEPVAAQLSVPGMDAGPSGRGSAGMGSRRLGPASDAPIQSYLVVEPFEIRHEVMLRLGGLAARLGLDPDSTIEAVDQPALAERLIAFVLESATVRADRNELGAASRRAGFMTVDATGALPRTTPVPEPVGPAVVGVVVGYPTSGMPEKVSLTWEPFPDSAGTVPSVMIDPESVETSNLTAAEPALVWTNNLTEDPIPTVDAVEVEPFRITVPMIAAAMLGLAIIVLVVGRRRQRAEISIAAARVLVAAAVLVAPFAQVTLASLPGTVAGTPSERQARRILAGLLPNVYRAMEFRDESLIYDRLAVSVTGETLTEVYLAQRRTLELEERGGAQARVEAVEILEAGEIESRDPGFDVDATWTAAGMVTHFGHRHFRQNRYNARIMIVPVEGTWKIRSIEILEQDRLK
jgi:hypothetical protein